MGTTAVLPIGTPLINYNRWTNFETREFQGQFMSLSPEEIKSLKVGDIVYTDVDHANGKVFGKVKNAIIALEPLSGGETRIHLDGGKAGNSFCTTTGGKCNRLEKAVSEEALAEIVKRVPLSTKINSFDL